MLVGGYVDGDAGGCIQQCSRSFARTLSQYTSSIVPKQFTIQLPVFERFSDQLDYVTMPLDVQHLGPDGQPLDFVAMPLGMYPR